MPGRPRGQAGETAARLPGDRHRDAAAHLNDQRARPPAAPAARCSSPTARRRPEHRRSTCARRPAGPGSPTAALRKSSRRTPDCWPTPSSHPTTSRTWTAGPCTGSGTVLSPTTRKTAPPPRCCWPAPATPPSAPWSDTHSPASTRSPGTSPNATPLHVAARRSERIRTSRSSRCPFGAYLGHTPTTGGTPCCRADSTPSRSATSSPASVTAPSSTSGPPAPAPAAEWLPSPPAPATPTPSWNDRADGPRLQGHAPLPRGRRGLQGERPARRAVEGRARRSPGATPGGTCRRQVAGLTRRSAVQRMY